MRVINELNRRYMGVMYALFGRFIGITYELYRHYEGVIKELHELRWRIWELYERCREVI